jgi:hypothetical protein
MSQSVSEVLQELVSYVVAFGRTRRRFTKAFFVALDLVMLSLTNPSFYISFFTEVCVSSYGSSDNRRAEEGTRGFPECSFVSTRSKSAPLAAFEPLNSDN